MTPALARLLLFAGLATCSACIPLWGGHSVERKVVAEKSGTSLLIADDGTVCTVSPKVFASVAVGDPKTCGWGPADGSVRDTRIKGARQPPITSKPPR